MNNPDPTDPVRAIAVVLAIFISDRIANAAAPHAAVFIAGMAGAYFGLSDWRKCSRTEAAAYIVGFGAWAWFLATMLASALHDHLPQSPYLPQLCAVGVGWLGHRITRVFRRNIPGGEQQ